MQVSVIVLTAPRMVPLERCIESLARQTVRPSEVIVVCPAHNLGDLGTMLEKFRGRLDLSPVERPRGGYAEARNKGVESATGDIIAFIDDDCEAEPDWLERLLPRLEHAVAVGGSVLPADPLPAPEGYCPELAWAVGLTAPGFFGPRGGREVLPQTANLAFRAEIAEKYPYQEIGGDLSGDASDYDVGREDAEWWRRLRRAGEVVAVEPRAIVWHHISRDRVDLDTIRERAHSDGRAFWARERPVHALPGAAADIIATLERSARAAAEPHLEPAQAWAMNAIWAERQLAFLSAAVDDPKGTISPMDRTRAFVDQGAAQLKGVAKAGLRPLAAALVEASRRERDNLFDAPPRRILVVLHPFLGDAVLAIPMLEQLAAIHPEAEKTLLTGQGIIPLLDDQHLGYGLLAVPDGAKGNSPRAILRLRDIVRRLEPDAIVLTYIHGLSPIPFVGSGAVTIGWTQDNGTEQRLWSQLLTVPVEKRLDQHESIAMLNLLAPLGVKPHYQHPRIIPSDKARERTHEILGRFGVRPRSYVVLHVENPREAKYWSIEGFAHVAAEILKKTDYVVVLEGSKGGRAAAEKVKKEVPQCIIAHGALNTAELAVALSEAVAFCGADSGPQHVAAAVGCPSLVLFGPTPVHKWGPLPSFVGVPAKDSRRVLVPQRTDFTADEIGKLGPRATMAQHKPEVVAAELLKLIEDSTKKS